MKTNKNMPNTSIEYIKKIVKNYKSKKILILGMSYREGIADFRDSPSIFLYNKLKKLGAKVEANDPNWFHGQEKNFKKIIRQKNKLGYYDILIFCTPHKIYNKINLKNLSKSQIIIDLNNVISGKNFKNLSRKKMKIYTLGKN
jgi:UDP-N-acetyl-D-glucosamine dehydrogenase